MLGLKLNHVSKRDHRKTTMTHNEVTQSIFSRCDNTGIHCMLVAIFVLGLKIARRYAGGCFTNVSRALQHILTKFVCCRNRTSYDHFKLKLCSCAQSHALSTRTKFQLEILTINVITGIVYFREIILESSQNVSETTPRFHDFETSPITQEDRMYCCLMNDCHISFVLLLR